MMMRTIALLPLAAFACTQPTAPPAPAPLAEEEPVNLAVAVTLVADIQAKWPSSTDHPLLTPSSIDDVWKILKLDQMVLFPAGVRFARTLEGVDALALEAQIELAWGESYLTLLEIMMVLAERYEAAEAALAARADLDAAGKEELAWLRDTLHQTDRWAEAFQLLSIDHTTRGSARADEVIVKHPDNYVGYRVAADYYRMVRDWKKFDDMVAKLEKLNPDSNGLVFQRGASALQRDGNEDEAAKYFRQALTNDPEFVRAQAHLIAMQPTLDAMSAEYRALAELNADHQIVQWAGPGIEWAQKQLH